MRQLWISAAILAGMVLLLFWNGAHLKALASPLLEDLDRAAQAAIREDWTTADRLTKQVQDRWEGHTNYLRLVQFHGEIDEVSMLLKEARGFLAVQDAGEYTAMNVRIAGTLEALSGLEEIDWGNLL